jgi:hypothetical protein
MALLLSLVLAVAGLLLLLLPVELPGLRAMLFCLMPFWRLGVPVLLPGGAPVGERSAGQQAGCSSGRTYVCVYVS